MSEAEGKENSRDLLELSTAVANRIVLLDVWLAKTSAERKPGNRSDVTDAMLKTAVSSGVNVNTESKVLIALPKFELIAKTKTQPERLVFQIEAAFVLAYRISSLEGLEQKNFDAFANVNAVFNAWPYWREYVQSTSQRMGLSSLVVPIYRINETRPDAHLRSGEPTPLSTPALPPGPSEPKHKQAR